MTVRLITSMQIQCAESFCFCILALLLPQFLITQISCHRAGISNGWMLNKTDSEVQQIAEASSATASLYFKSDFAWSDVQFNDPYEFNRVNVGRAVTAAIQNNLEVIAILDYFMPWADKNTDTI